MLRSTGTLCLCELPIQWTAHGETAALKNMGVNHRSLHILMPQEFLHGADVVAVFEQVGGKAVAEGVRTNPFGDARLLGCASDRFL